MEPIVPNRLASGPVNVLGTTRSTLANGGIAAEIARSPRRLGERVLLGRRSLGEGGAIANFAPESVPRRDLSDGEIIS